MKTESLPVCALAAPGLPTTKSDFVPRQPARTSGLRPEASTPTPARKFLLITRAMLLAVVLPHLFTGPAAGGQTVSIAWDPVTNAMATGYAFYYGATSSNYTTRIDAGTNTAVTLSGLAEGQTNYFAVASYNAARVEGSLSPEIKFLVPGVLVKLSGTNASRFKFPVAVGHWYEIQASTNLVSWSNISQTTNSTSNAWVTFQDPQAASYSKRFYRLVLH